LHPRQSYTVHLSKLLTISVTESLKFINSSPSTTGMYGTLIGVFDAQTGMLTLTSASGVSALQMQNALRSITYKNSDENPAGSSRSISYTVTDGNNSDSNTLNSTVNLTAVNDAPFFTAGLKYINLTGAKETTGLTITYNDLKGSGTIDDVDSSAASLKFIISSIDTSKGTLTKNGTAITSATLTSTTPENIALKSIGLNDSLVWTPNASVVTEETSLNYILPFSVKVSDGLLTSASSVGIKISVENTNQAPIIKGGVISELVTYTENGTGTAITTAATISDPDSIASKIYGATVVIKAGSDYLPEDTLTLVPAYSTMGDITATWDEDTGTLTLVSATGVTAAQMTTALKAIKYTNSNDNPSVTNRTVSYTVSDGEVENGVSQPYTTTMKVTAINDAPVFGNASIELGTTMHAQEGQAFTISYDDLVDKVTDAEGNTISFGISTITANSGKIYKVSGSTETEITATNMLTMKIGVGESFKWIPGNVVNDGGIVTPFKVKAYDGQNTNALSATELSVNIYVDDFNNNGTPPVVPVSVTINSATLVAPEIPVPALPTGTTYTDGFVTITFTSATTGTVSDPSSPLPYTVTLANGVISIKATVSGITQTLGTYKLLASDDTSLILAQTDTNLTTEMNDERNGPPVVLTLIKAGTVAQAIPSSGSIDLYTTQTDHFGDQNWTQAIKQTFNFTDHTITKYAINGAIISTENFTIDQNTMIIDDGNGHHAEVTLYSNGDNGYYACKSTYADTQNWGDNSANEATTIQAYITAKGGYLFQNSDGSYGKLLNYNGNTGTYTYENNWNGQVFKTTATLTTNNSLVINWGDQQESYSVVNASIQHVQSGIESFAMAKNNPFSYTYTITDAGNVTPITPIDSVTIDSAKLIAPQSNITFTAGATYTDGYVTFKMTSATAGTLSELNGPVHTVTLTDGIASVFTNGQTFSYKLLASDANSLVLGQIDTNLTSEMNTQLTNTPPVIWTLLKPTATAITLPASGTINLFTTKTDNFGDMRGTNVIKETIDFTQKIITKYGINGAVIATEHFTVSSNKIVTNVTTNTGTFHQETSLYSNGSTGYYTFKDTYVNTDNWGPNSANGLANINVFISSNNGIVWQDPDTGNYGKLLNYNGVTGTYTYENKWQGQVATTTATLTNTSLVINWGNEQETYSVVNGAIQHVQNGADIGSFATSNPFDYTYTVGELNPITPLIGPVSHIVNATMNLPLTDILVFPLGTYDMGNQTTITFSSDTAGHVNFIDNGVPGVAEVILANGIATFTMPDTTTYQYKLLAADAHSIVLGDTVSNVMDEINASYHGPSSIMTLLSTAEPITAQVFPTQGELILYTTDMYDYVATNNQFSNPITMDMYFDSNVVSESFFNNGSSIFNFTIDGNNVMSLTEGNGAVDHYTLLDTNNNFFIFEKTTSWSNEYASASEKSDISAYLATNDGYIWRDAQGGYGQITGNTTDGYLYTNVKSGKTDTASAHFTDDNHLVVDWGSYTQTYSVDTNTNTITQLNFSDKLVTYSTTNPFTITSAPDLIFQGTTQNDSMIGNIGSNYFNGKAGNDVMDAKVDNVPDSFSYKMLENEGHDTIKNFDVTKDYILVTDVDKATFDGDFNTYVTITQNGANTDITLSYGTVITLVGITASTVTTHDFKTMADLV